MEHWLKIPENVIRHRIFRFRETFLYSVEAPVGRGAYWLRSWQTAIEWVANAKSIIDRGYYEHRDKTGAFQVPTLSENHVLICSDQLVEEFRNAREDQLSFTQRVADVLQLEFTIGPGLFFNGWHIPFIRNQLTKGLEGFTIPLMEEFKLAIEDHMMSNSGQWTSVKAYGFCSTVIARGMSRTFVGLELCRNKEYLKTTLEFTQQLFIAANLLRFIPTPVKYLISPLINERFLNKPLRISKRLLAPIIEERKRRAQEEGEDWKGRPDDMLQWLIEGAPESEQSTDALVLRMTEVNMSALHTTGATLYECLFRLAMHPEYIPDLRQEINYTIVHNGWTKVAMAKLVKLDSFMRETHRFSGTTLVSMGRKVIGKGFTFSNALHLPAGVTVSIPETPHMDEREYENAHVFDGFRFSRPFERGEVAQGIDNKGSKRKYFTTASTDFLRFGYGHSVCPGRFFAAHKIKIILCLMVMYYDIRLEDKPRPVYFEFVRGSDLNACLSFKRRQSEIS
ncbi:cytochrome P450 [Tirmania nivea]|nr:cytochrome P450 [Tirmania nivea]